jgi:hypothetical protein
MVTPFIFMEQDARTTPSPNQDRIWHERSLLGILTYLTHTWSLHCWAIQLKCVEFKLAFIIFPQQELPFCCSRCSSHVLRCHLSFVILNLHLKWLVSKNIRRRVYPRELSVFNRLPTEGYTQGGKFWVRRRRDQELEGARNTRLLDRFGPHGA